MGRAWRPGGRCSHQGVEVIAQQGPVVVDLPLQDDEQEEQPQQDVPQVAQDVVEGAGTGDMGRMALAPYSGLFPMGGRHWQNPGPYPLTLAHPPTPADPHLRLPSGWAQRKL